MRLVRSFIQVVREDPRLCPGVLDDLDEIEADARVPIATAHALLRAAVTLTGDELLGVRAAAKLSIRDSGLLGYTIASSANLDEALRVGNQYMRLVSDVTRFGVVRRDGEAEVHFEYRVGSPRAAVDFMVCGMLAICAQAWPGLMSSETRLCLRHVAPRDASPYREVLPSPRLSFSAPFFGFAFPEAWLDAPSQHADRELHAVLRRSADLFVADLPPIESVTERVRSALLAQLADGLPDLAYTAKQLRMSPRTLGRRLEAEGTTFSAILDALRYDLATHYLREHDAAIQDVAARIGFSQRNGFHRAFRRWTGTTPKLYSRSHRGGALGM